MRQPAHLDAARLVIWDITRIAASGAPGARDLIHDVIQASASIPGAFPLVLIEVEAEGRRHDEMHVDGGITGQLFFGTKGIDWDRVVERLGIESSEPFEPPYMKALSELGYDLGRKGNPWTTVND